MKPLARSLAAARSRVRARGVNRVRSEGGRRDGVLSTWNPRRLTEPGEAMDGRTLMLRAEDLVDNDPHAASVVGTMATNIVGTGLNPQAQVRQRLLGLSDGQAAEVHEAQEWAWRQWCAEAHVGGRCQFADIQLLNVLAVLAKGEFLNLVRLVDRPGRNFALCLQDVHPARLVSPAERLLDPDLHDGVETDGDGFPRAYWIANPDPKNYWSPAVLSAGQCVRVEARRGHLPQVLHGFPYEREESFRGRSILAPAMRQFRLSYDSVDYELIAQITAASVPVFIASQDPQAAWERGAEQDPENPLARYQSISPGQVAYGNPNEKPFILESNRPGNNFDSFMKLILRALAAATGMPYEVLSKDFSQTNYSSARAALLEAWRVFRRYRSWMERLFCQPVWAMVQEEAFLRGYWRIPAGAPDFYAQRAAWTAARWIGPARGYVDPVKEILATVTGLKWGLTTWADAIAEQGGDVDAVYDQLAREKAKRDERGIIVGDPGRTATRPDAAAEREEAAHAETDAAA